MDLTSTIEVPAIVVMLLCILAFIGTGALSRMFMPKIIIYAVIEPNDGHVVAYSPIKERAESLVHGNRMLITLKGTVL